MERWKIKIVTRHKTRLGSWAEHRHLKDKAKQLIGKRQGGATLLIPSSILPPSPILWTRVSPHLSRMLPLFNSILRSGSRVGTASFPSFAFTTSTRTLSFASSFGWTTSLEKEDKRHNPNNIPIHAAHLDLADSRPELLSAAMLSALSKSTSSSVDWIPIFNLFRGSNMDHMELN